MPFGDWDEVLEIYRETYAYSRYSEHAKGMLALIPQIRGHPGFEDTLPGTSHATFFLELPEIRKSVMVWCESQGIYRVYIYHPVSGNSNEIAVEMDAVIPKLLEYLQLIQEA